MTTDDRDQMAWTHYIPGDRAECKTSLSGRLLRYSRPHEPAAPPRKVGASVINRQRFMACDTTPCTERMELDTGTAFILGLLIGSSCIASAGMLWWVFA